jgi:hypothetical protein
MSNRLTNTDSAEAAATDGLKPWAAPVVIVSAVKERTKAKTSSGFGFETHSPGSLNGS